MHQKEEEKEETFLQVAQKLRGQYELANIVGRHMMLKPTAMPQVHDTLVGTCLEQYQEHVVENEIPIPQQCQGIVVLVEDKQLSNFPMG